MIPPTDRELDVLEYMRGYQREHGMPPTTREICAAFGWKSTNAAVDHLQSLKRKHLVTHRPLVSRGWLALPPSAGEEGIQ